MPCVRNRLDPGWTWWIRGELLETDVRREAVRALGRLGVKEAASQVVSLLNDPDLEVRVAALSSLGMLGDTSFAPKVAPLLEDPERRIRQSAALALGYLVKGPWPTNRLDDEIVEQARRWWKEHGEK
jgi:HEAT repeat protein